MKSVPCLAAVLVFCASVLVPAAKADPAPNSSSSVDKDPNTPASPNVPESEAAVTDPLLKQAARTKEDADKKDAEEKEKSRDWLLRSYEQQFQANTSHAGKDEYNNIFYQISTDKDLAKLAGVTILDPGGGTPLGSSHLGGNNSDKNPISLRPDPSLEQAGQPGGNPTSIFKPLITPLAATGSFTVQNFYANPPAAAPLASNNNTPPPAPPPPKSNLHIDPAALDMPGLTAAETGAMPSDPALELNLDQLPDESPADAKNHSSLTLQEPPPSTNAARAQSVVNSALKVPGQTKTAAPVLTAAQLKFKADPAPPVTAPPPSPIRNPIGDPRDILNR